MLYGVLVGVEGSSGSHPFSILSPNADSESHVIASNLSVV
jgi:hypothetical protein